MWQDKLFFERKLPKMTTFCELFCLETENTLERLMKDVPTLEQFRDTLEKQVKRDARRVYLIPKEGGGMLALAVASLSLPHQS